MVGTRVRLPRNPEKRVMYTANYDGENSKTLFYILPPSVINNLVF